MLDEIEKYLLEIFENKAKSIENKQRFYERILKKIEQGYLGTFGKNATKKFKDSLSFISQVPF